MALRQSLSLPCGMQVSKISWQQPLAAQEAPEAEQAEPPPCPPLLEPPSRPPVLDAAAVSPGVRAAGERAPATEADDQEKPDSETTPE